MKKAALSWLLAFPLMGCAADFTALLINSESDALFHFRYQGRAFSCEPAAIVTLTQLYYSKGLAEGCRKALVAFAQKYPYAAKQHHYLLHEDQTYYIHPYKEKCFIMLNGGISYSEYLVENGFAKMQSTFENGFFGSPLYQKLQKAQKRATYHGRGLWKDPMVSSCFSQK